MWENTILIFMLSGYSLIVTAVCLDSRESLKKTLKENKELREELKSLEFPRIN